MVVVAPAASAASSTKFCAAIDKLETKLSDVNSGKTFNANQYKDAGAAFKSAAKSAPKKLEKAMATIGSFLSAVGSGDAAGFAKAFTSSNAKNYTKALTTYSTYVATNC